MCEKANRILRKNRLDIAAALLLGAVFFIYLFAAKHGIGVGDESFYLTIPHRLLKGDNLIIDEWHLSQFSALFELLPFKWYYGHFGSTEGIILFFRTVFVCLFTGTAAILWTVLRRYKEGGLFALLIFTASSPLMIFTVNYYTLYVMGVAVVCVCGILKGKNRLPGLILIGVLYGCLVLVQPLSIMMAPLYIAITAVKKAVNVKKPGFLSKAAYIVDFRTLAPVAAGAAVVGTVILVFLLTRADVGEYLAAFRNLFTSPEYNFDPENGNILNLSVLKDTVMLYGTVPTAVIAVLTVAALIVRQRNAVLNRIIAAVGIVMLVLTLSGLYRNFYCHDVFSESDAWLNTVMLHGFTISATAPLFWFLSPQREKKLMYTWITAVIFDVVISISSDISSWQCSQVSGMITVILIVDYLKTHLLDAFFRKDKGKMSLSAGAKLILNVTALSVAVISFAAVICAEGQYLVSHTDKYLVETFLHPHRGKPALTVELDRGPMKGIMTEESIKSVYDNILDDLDTIRDMNCRVAYMEGVYPYCYLYLDMPYCVYSTWFEKQGLERQYGYWKLHPDKIPDVIYLCNYGINHYENFRSSFDPLQVNNKSEYARCFASVKKKSGKAGMFFLVKGLLVEETGG